MAQTRWMLDLLLVMVPEHSEDENQEQDHHYIMNNSLQRLDEDAKVLAEKLDYFSKCITKYQNFYLFIQFTVRQILLTRVTKNECIL